MMKFYFLISLGMMAWVATAAPANSPKPFVLDLPLSGSAKLPWWLEVSDGGMESMFGTRSFGVTPPEGDWDLAVTVYYDETPGGSLRIYWSSAQRTEILSDDLYEGSGLPNQRTILIRRGMLSQPGKLTFQAATSLMNPWRIRWEWLKPTTVWASDAKADEWALIDDFGATFTTKEISGELLYHPTDFWQRRVVTAYLSERVERFETAIEFSANLESEGEMYRLTASLAGVSMDEPLGVWINGEWIGDLAMEIPDLNNSAYRAGTDGKVVFSGWRKGSILIPHGKLHIGENRFQLGFDSTGETFISHPLAIKNVALQIKYQEPSSAGRQNNRSTAQNSDYLENP